jgi:hypothetical protein
MGATMRTEWLTSFKVFTLGAFVASKLEIALWDAFLESVKATLVRGVKSSASLCDPAVLPGLAPEKRIPAVSGLPRERVLGDGVGSSAADGEMALRSKAHLAEFWNRLVPAERRKILGIEDNVVDPRQCRSFRTAPGFGIDHSITGSSLTSGDLERDGDRGDDCESANAFDESDTESGHVATSAVQSSAWGGSSVDVPRSVESFDPSSQQQPSSALSVKSDHYHRGSGGMRYQHTTRRHSGAHGGYPPPLSSIGSGGGGSTSVLRLHRSGSGRATDALNFATGASSTAASTRSYLDGDSDNDNDYSVDDDGASDCPDVWPWCAVRWPGRELVASLFQSPLERAGNHRESLLCAVPVALLSFLWT